MNFFIHDLYNCPPRHNFNFHAFVHAVGFDFKCPRIDASGVDALFDYKFDPLPGEPASSEEKPRGRKASISEMT